jgi:type II secretory pathway component PulK
MRKRIHQPTDLSRRRGAALIAAMIAVLLASAIGTILLKTALAQRRTAIREQRRQQSIWLAESAIDRAAAKLSRDGKYAGETWTVSAADLGGRDGARVVIKVAGVQSAAGLRTVSVTAEYPHDSPHRSRTTKSVTVDLDAFRKPKSEPKTNPEQKKP